MYTKQHFKKWDRSPIEKLHLKFCERYLEINNKASNKAYRAGHEIAPDHYRHYNTKPKRLSLPCWRPRFTSLLPRWRPELFRFRTSYLYVMRD